MTGPGSGRHEFPTAISRHGWRPVTASGLARVEDGRFALVTGNGDIVEQAPLLDVRAYFTRFLFHSTVTVWINDDWYVLGKGRPSEEQLRQVRFAAATGTGMGGASARGLLDSRGFAKALAEWFQAVGGRWEHP